MTETSNETNTHLAQKQRGFRARNGLSQDGLAEESSPTTHNQSLCAFSPSRRCQPVCDADAGHLLCVLRRRLAPAARGRSTGPLKQSETFAELVFLGMNPPLPDLKRRILGNSKKSFHARTLDTSDLVSDKASCIASRTAPW